MANETQRNFAQELAERDRAIMAACAEMRALACSLEGNENWRAAGSVALQLGVISGKLFMSTEKPAKSSNDAT